MQATVWPRLTEAFGKQARIWNQEERDKTPGVTDKIIDYVISYADKPSVARKACRTFVGIDGDPEFGWTILGSLDETRVATIREVAEVLQLSGCEVDSYSLAKTIKEFLKATWEAFDTTSLDRGPSSLDKDDLSSYMNTITAILPDSAITYLKYLWSQTRKAPYDIYADRIICRLGLSKPTDAIFAKKQKLYDLIENKKPMIRHKKLVMLGKRVCLSKDPRCNVCPLAAVCNYAKQMA